MSKVFTIPDADRFCPFCDGFGTVSTFDSARGVTVHDTCAACGTAEIPEGTLVQHGLCVWCQIPVRDCCANPCLQRLKRDPDFATLASRSPTP